MSSIKPRGRRLLHREASRDDGSAVVEFLALAVLLLIPAVWFLVAVAQIQSASYAAVGAADQAAKMYTAAEAPPDERAARSEAAVAAVLADYGIAPVSAEVSQQCSPGCDEPEALVGFTVEVRVPLPMVPEFGGWEHTLVTVSSTASHLQQGRPDGQGQP